jgi:hypothetical protein
VGTGVTLEGRNGVYRPYLDNSSLKDLAHDKVFLSSFLFQGTREHRGDEECTWHENNAPTSVQTHTHGSAPAAPRQTIKRGVEGGTNIGADAWDGTCYGHSAYDEALAEDITELDLSDVDTVASFTHVSWRPLYGGPNRVYSNRNEWPRG